MIFFVNLCGFGRKSINEFLPLGKTIKAVSIQCHKKKVELMVLESGACTGLWHPCPLYIRFRGEGGVEECSINNLIFYFKLILPLFFFCCFFIQLNKIKNEFLNSNKNFLFYMNRFYAYAILRKTYNCTPSPPFSPSTKGII